MNQQRRLIVTLRFMKQATTCIVATLAIAVGVPHGYSQEPAKTGVWVVHRDEEAGIQIHTMEMTLYPRPESNPALKHQFIADDIHLLDGNAATYYLKAQGFFEQTSARERLTEIHAKALEQARSENKSHGDVPPHSWLSMPPQDLPVEEVKKYLTLTSFQPWFLEEGAKQRRFDLDRNIHSAEDPIGYLLPEIQTMRELARTQSLRCKAAIAEGRIDDAMVILGQQYAMARHLGQDDFLVTSLVGMAIAGIASTDALYLVQRSETPNLYWAFASLPDPLVDVRYAMSVERQFLYLQCKVLREVDEPPRPAGYWQDFLDRLIPQIQTLSSEIGIDQKAPETSRALLLAYVAAAYPGAKRYLIEDLGMSREQVEAYPTAQAVFLAITRFYDSARDDVFKWAHLPYWQVRGVIDSPHFEEAFRQKADRAGWSSVPTQAILPGVMAVQRAVARNQQKLALVQTVEAIRMYGAAHEGQLPRSLDDLPVPAPMEPFTGKPIDYEFHGEYAILNGHEMPGMRYKLILRFADASE